MKLFYRYIGHLFAYIQNHDNVAELPHRIFSRTIEKHKPGISGRHILLTFFCFILFSEVQAQSPNSRGVLSRKETIQPIIVGEKVLDEFWTKEHLFYINGDTIRKSLNEYKGKLLIIDFWATWCGACRANFPKLVQLKETFGDEINIILVNPLIYKDSIGKIIKAYNEFTDSTAASLASVVLDEYIIDRFPHLGIPRYIWINPKGRFTASTGNLFVDSEQIRKILEGKY